MKVQALTKNFFKFNDSISNLYFIVMLLFLFAPTFFITSNPRNVSLIVMSYLVAYVMLNPKFQRKDFSQNFIKYGIYLLASLLIFSVIVSSSLGSDIVFTGLVGIFLYHIFVVGLSETQILIALEKKLGNPLITIFVMSLLHITSYMFILGDFAFSVSLFKGIIGAFVGFFMFWMLWKITNDRFVVAIIHGIYNIVLLGLI